MKQPVIIEREVLLDLLDVADTYGVGDGENENFTDDHERSVYEAKEACAKKFIPVSERLPKVGQLCDVLIVDGSLICNATHEQEQFGSIKYWQKVGERFYVAAGRFNTVTHWRERSAA